MKPNSSHTAAIFICVLAVCAVSFEIGRISAREDERRQELATREVVYFSSQGEIMERPRIEEHHATLEVPSGHMGPGRHGHHPAYKVKPGSKKADKPKASIIVDTGDYYAVTVFYGTNRKQTASRDPKALYGKERGTLELGQCRVSVPHDHKTGVIERPSIWRLEFNENPASDVVLLEVTPLAEMEFIENMDAAIEGSRDESAFVFVHGFNVSFEEAAWRTAQMAYDLEFSGVPSFFSWPSQSSTTETGYIADFQTSQWAVPAFVEFLTIVRSKTKAKRIHIIAHSMGNKLLSEVMSQLHAKPDSARNRFNQVILTAPDIDSEIYLRDFNRSLVELAERVTLYASSNDWALKVSRNFAGNHQRLGESDPTITIVQGIESIDASSVDTSFIGHFYYADNQSILSDLYYLLRDGKGADGRFHLKPKVLGTGKYWLLKP